MTRPPALRQFDRLRVRVKLRRGADAPDWATGVKPEAEWLDGKELNAEVWWMQDDEDPYPGEWAIGLSDLNEIPRGCPIWVGSGDVEVLEIL